MSYIHNTTRDFIKSQWQHVVERHYPLAEIVAWNVCINACDGTYGTLEIRLSNGMTIASDVHEDMAVGYWEYPTAS